MGQAYNYGTYEHTVPSKITLDIINLTIFNFQLHLSQYEENCQVRLGLTCRGFHFHDGRSTVKQLIKINT